MCGGDGGGARRRLGHLHPSRGGPTRRIRGMTAFAALLACVALSTVVLHRRATTGGTIHHRHPRAGADRYDYDGGRGGGPTSSSSSSSSSSGGIVIDIARMRNLTLAHGTFYFGPHSHEVYDVGSSSSSSLEYYGGTGSSWNAIQGEMLDDGVINVDRERERCARYNFDLVNETHPKRRRLFMGALIGDDSMEVLRAVAAESHDVFHTVSYVEGFQAHDLSPRDTRYYDVRTNGAPTDELLTLLRLFGPNTRVSVDYYDTSMTELVGQFGDLFMDFVGREGNTHRWALNGMREDDVGIIGDADEVFTRDFLRALQICDVPELRGGQNCLEAQVKSSTLVYESSPNCLTRDRRWFHPDAILGECVDNVGNATRHPPTKRDYADRHGLEIPGYGAGGSDFRPNYTLYHETGMGPYDTYPLWHGTDVRMKWIGRTYAKNDGSATAYHFHNFFKSTDEIHKKYATYGHAKGDRAYNMPIWALQEDIKVGVDCVNRIGDKYLDFNNSGGTVLPIYYLNDDVRNRRHEHWERIVRDEEEIWRKKLEGMQDLENENQDCWMNCGERAGECRHFCGKRGVCCQVGHENSKISECGDGTLGCVGRECCVSAATAAQ